MYAGTNWRVYAACDLDVAEAFFDPDREAEARAICGDCPVRRECAADASTAHPAYGVWAGGRYRSPERGRARSGLSDTTVARIRARHAAGETMKGLAREHGVDRNTVRNYVRGRCRAAAGEANLAQQQR